MDSSAAVKILSKEIGNNSFPTVSRSPISHRTNSFSSSSSPSSCSSSFRSLDHDPHSPLSPATPLRFSGVPFSWEQLPGIPKKQTTKPKKNDPTTLPLLPPPATPPNSKLSNFQEMATRKKNTNESYLKRDHDPFFAAFVECCKDEKEDQGSSNMNKLVQRNNLSDRFGFVNLYTSCKRTCAVSESIIYVPRSTTRTSHDPWNRRSA